VTRVVEQIDNDRLVSMLRPREANAPAVPAIAARFKSSTLPLRITDMRCSLSNSAFSQRLVWIFVDGANRIGARQDDGAGIKGDSEREIASATVVPPHHIAASRTAVK